jgi:hypothetical protein
MIKKRKRQNLNDFYILNSCKVPTFVLHNQYIDFQQYLRRHKELETSHAPTPIRSTTIYIYIYIYIGQQRIEI